MNIPTIVTASFWLNASSLFAKKSTRYNGWDAKFARAVLSACFALGFLIGTMPSARAADSPAKDSEVLDRTVDEAALDEQAAAVLQLKSLLKEHRGTPQEANLLGKLAEIQQEDAAMQFRVAHGLAKRNGRPPNLATYHKVMAESIPTLSELMTKFPNYEDIAHVTFMRGKAYEETEQKPQATRDYLRLVQAYPNAPECPEADLSLADFAIAAGNQSQAITYLHAIEKHPEDPHYPLALYRLAWSFYRSSNFPAALDTSERLVGYFRKQLSQENQDKQTATSQAASLENILHDIPTFYFAAYEKILPGYTTARALEYFGKLATGDEFGPISVQYANLLRSHDHEKDLMVWKDGVLAARPGKPDSFEVLMVTYDYQLNRGHYEHVVRSAKDIAKMFADDHHSEAARRAQKLLLDTSTRLQKLMLENKGATKEAQLGQELAVVYDAFTKIVDENDPRIITIHANLAETLFAIQDYDQATQNYRWVAAHEGWNERRGGMSGADASLKAISSRYESLRGRKLVPTSLNAVALPEKDKSSNDPQVTEWVGWIDLHVSHTGNPIDNFQFEADRTLYSLGQVNLATQRLRAFALRNAKSTYAIPAATLVVDTYIASSRWDQLGGLAQELLGIQAWKGTAFTQRVYKLAADAKYKYAETLAARKDHAGVIQQVDEFLRQYPKSAHRVDALTLAGNSAVAIGNRGLAIRYYTQLAQAEPDSKNAAQARLQIAKLEEERYAFASAAREYQVYASFPQKTTGLKARSMDELRKRILTLAWLGGDAAQLGALLKRKAFCGPALRADCDRYEALFYFMGSTKNEKITKLAVRKAGLASASVRAIWAALALENGGALSPSVRHRMIEALESRWKGLEPLARYSLIPRIAVSVPRAFELDRQAIAAGSRLTLNERVIARHLNLIREMETSATEAAKLPWTRIRALVLDEMGAVYADLAAGIRNIPMSKRLKAKDRPAYVAMVEQLVSPFDRKSQEIRAEAFRLASQSMIESGVYNAVAHDFFAGDPRHVAVVPKQKDALPLDLQLVRTVDAQGGWNSAVNLDTADRGQILRARWSAALESHNWPQVAYFATDGNGTLLPADVRGLAKAVSLAEAGARAEGAMVLSDLCRGGERADHIRAACPASGAML